MSCTTVPSNLIPRVSPAQRAATINGKRKQPASDTNNVFGMSDTMDNLPQGMQPQQIDQHQLQPDGHDQQQQLDQQLPTQEPQQLPLQQQCLGHGQGSGIQSQGASAAWTADLGRVVAWCFSKLVEKHLLAELQVGCCCNNQCCCCCLCMFSV
jgi:hypothetical protein